MTYSKTRATKDNTAEYSHNPDKNAVVSTLEQGNSALLGLWGKCSDSGIFP